jgi:hypothetical protein
MPHTAGDSIGIGEHSESTLASSAAVLAAHHKAEIDK